MCSVCSQDVLLLGFVGLSPGVPAETERAAQQDRPNIISASQTEVCDHRTVPLDVVVLDIVEETTAPTDEHQQASPAVMILLVGLQMLGEVVDALARSAIWISGDPVSFSLSSNAFAMSAMVSAFGRRLVAM